MCRDKARHSGSRIDIPCGAYVQDRTVGRKQRAIHRIASSMFRFLAFDGLILARVAQERLSEQGSRSDFETKSEKEHGFAAARGVGGI